MKMYYLNSENKPTGPVTLEELNIMIRAGVVKPDPQVALEGQTEWRLLSSLTGPAVAPGVPPGVPPGAPPIGAPNEASKAAAKAMAASQDAWKAVRTFAVNPVGGLPEAFNQLGEQRAFGAGIAFAVISILSTFLLVYRFLHDLAASFGGGHMDFGDLVKILVLATVPFLSLLAVCFGARMALRGSGQIAHDFFLAGACQIPLAVFNLAVLLFGFNNGNVLGVIAVFALCFVILMLFVGLTKIYRLSEQVSAFAVPIMLILGGFVGKLIFSALVSHMGPQTTPFAF